MLHVHEFRFQSSHVYQMCKNQLHMRAQAACCQGEKHSLYVNNKMQLYVYEQTVYSR